MSENKSIFLEWNNINYKILKSKKNNQVSDNSKIILNNISGFALPNQILAILGPSGCGKTTLLNVISKRQINNLGKDHKIERNVLSNGVDLSGDEFGHLCAYVMQDDVLLSTFTPRESLMFAASLKLNLKKEEIKKKVDKLIKQFGLEKCQNTVIGSLENKKISGGERKRTSIAYELISNPSVVFLDEPTTGMDSFTSIVIMKYLKMIAFKGKTIICTIHQPGSEIFKLVDRIILMKSGEIAYQGPSNEVLSYLNNIGFELPKHCNPFDYCLTVLLNSNNLIKNKHIDSNTNIKEFFVKNYEEVVLNKLNKEKENNVSKFYYNKDESSYLANKNKIKYNVSWLFELYLLLVRSVKSYFRNKEVYYTRLIQYVSTSLLFMGFYFGIGNYKESVGRNILGISFNTTNGFFINGMFSSLFSIPVIRNVLKREYSAKLYRISTFYVAQVIVMLLPSFTISIIYTPIIYYSIQVETSFIKFLLFFITNFFQFTLGQTFGLFLGALFDYNKALIVSPLLFILFMLGSGFFRTNDSWPVYLRWINIISIYKYTLELYINIQKDFNYSTKLLPDLFGYNQGLLTCIIVLICVFILVFVCGYFSVKRFSAKF